MTNKKRILMLNYEFPPLGGGASPVSYEIAKGYAKLGHKVDVVTMGFKGLPSEEKKEGMRIFRVPYTGEKERDLSSLGTVELYLLVRIALQTFIKA